MREWTLEICDVMVTTRGFVSQSLKSLKTHIGYDEDGKIEKLFVFKVSEGNKAYQEFLTTSEASDLEIVEIVIPEEYVRSYQKYQFVYADGIALLLFGDETIDKIFQVDLDNLDVS